MPEALSEDVITDVAEAAGIPKKQSAQERANLRWGSGTSSPKAAETRAVQPPGSIKLKRSELIHGSNTGENVRIERHSAKGSEKIKGRELTITISPETVQKYSSFLDTYMTDLLKDAEKPAPTVPPSSPGFGASNLLEYNLQQPNSELAQAHKMLVDMLAKQNLGADGRTISYNIDPQKIAIYLQSEDSWAVTTMLMEQDAVIKELGLGAAAKMRNLAYNRQRDKGGIGVDRKVTTDLSYTLPRLLNAGIRGGWLGVTSGAYILFGAGKSKTLFESDAKLLEAMKTNATAEDKIFLKTRAGIDLDKLNIVNGNLQFDNGYQPNIKTIEESVAQNYSARQEFLEQLGVDKDAIRDRINASREIRFPEEHIFNNKTRPEYLSLRYEEEIRELESPLPPGTPNDERRYRRVEAKKKARMTVLLRYVQRQADKQSAVEDESARVISLAAMRKKKEMMQNNPEEFRAEERERREKTKGEAEQAKAYAQAQKTELVDGAKQKAEDVLILQRRLERSFGLSLDTDIEAAIKTKIGELAKDVADATKDVNDAEKDKRDKITKLTTDALDKIATARKDAATILAGGTQKGNITFPPDDVKAILSDPLEAIKESYEAQLTSLRQKQADAQSELARLKEQAEAYDDAVNEQDTVTFSISARNPGQIQASQAALAGLGIPAATAQSETVEQLMARQPAATPAAEKLRNAVLAKAAAEIEAPQFLPASQEQAITDLGTAGIATDEIWRSSDKEMLDRMKQYYASLPAGTTIPTDDELKASIEAARAGSGKILRTLAEVRLTNEIDYHDAIIKAEDKALKDLGNFKEKIADVDVVLGILNDQASIFDRAYKAENDQKLKSRLISTAPIQSVAATSLDMAYTDTERAANSDERVYEWYNLLSQYMNNPNRNEMYAVLQRILPPAKLDALLASVPANINTGPGRQQAAKTILNYLRSEAMAA